MTSQADVDAKNRRTGRRFFWTLLILATTTSLYGNVAHAISGAGGVSLNSIVCASIAPVFLMALVHGATHLARNTASGWAYWVVIASVGGVAAFAFAQSFGALTAFARDSHVLAPSLTPLIVDATIGVSTFALVVLEPKPATRVRSRPATAASMKPQAKPVAPPAALTSNRNTNRANATVSGDVERGLALKLGANASAGVGEPASSQSAPRAAVAGDRTFDLAAALVRDKETKQPVEVVRAVLAAHRNGDPLNRIAKNVERHHTAVKRIIDAAEARMDRPLAATG
jgi:hypothetical protein